MARLVLSGLFILWAMVLLITGGAVLFGRVENSDLIAFMSNRRLNPEIYVQDMGRFISIRITKDSEWADTPAWSHDGQLAYASNASGNWEIYVLDNLTGTATNTTRSSERNDYSPAWAYDGRLAFVSAKRNHPGEIYILDPVSGLSTNTRKVGMTPTWSADGHLAFSSNWTGNWEIYVYDLQADSAINVSNHRFDDWSPSWSADGRLVFMSSRAGNAEIFVLDLQTGVVTNVTNSHFYETSPAWMW
jgi:Tol biopolymer transport system component